MYKVNEMQDTVCANKALQWFLFSTSIILFLSTLVSMYWTMSRMNPRNKRNIMIKLFIQSNIVLLSILTAISRLCISSTTRFIFNVLASLVRTQAGLLTEILWFDISKTLETSVKMLQYVDRREVNITFLIFGIFMLVDWIIVLSLMIFTLTTANPNLVLGLNITGLLIASFVIGSSIALWLRIYNSVSKFINTSYDDTNVNDERLTAAVQKLTRFSKKATIVYSSFASLLSANMIFTIIFMSTDNNLWPIYTNDAIALGITICILVFTMI